MLALANLCNSEQNQTSVGASSACRLALHVCSHSTSHHVLKDASRLVCALSYGSFVNKTRLGEQNALPILLACCRRFGFHQSNTAAAPAVGRRGGGNVGQGGQGGSTTANLFEDAVAWCCRALASLLLHRGNQKLFREMWGIQVIVDLCLETQEQQVLYSSAMVLSSMVPSAEERFEARDEGRTIQVEQVRTFDALNRARKVLFGGRSEEGEEEDIPAWLETSWGVMGMGDKELAAAKARAVEGGARMDSALKEFIPRLDLFEERASRVTADKTVTTSELLGDLALRVF